MTLQPIRPDQYAETAVELAPARADTDSWLQVMGDVVRLSQHIADTEFVPRGLRGSAPATAAAILYGREVGLPPMTALSQTHVVEGKPTISAEAKRALVLAAGHEIQFTESTGAVCTVRGRRRGSDHWTSVTWNLDMARAAELATKKNWRLWPRRMLQARATSELCDLIFPDITHGFATTEDLQDAEDQASSAEVPARKTVQRRAKTTETAPAAGAAQQGHQAGPSRQHNSTTPNGPATSSSPGSDLPPLPGEDPHIPSSSSDVVRPSPTATASEDTSNRGRVEEDAPPATSDPATVGGEGTATGPSRPVSSPTPGRQDTSMGASPAHGSGEEDADSTTGTGAPSESTASSPPRTDPGRPATKAQIRMLFAALKGLGIVEDEERHRIAGALLGRDVDSFGSLNRSAVSTLIDTLARFSTGDKLREFLRTGLDPSSYVVEDPPGYDEGEPVEAELVDEFVMELEANGGYTVEEDD